MPRLLIPVLLSAWLAGPVPADGALRPELLDLKTGHVVSLARVVELSQKRRAVFVSEQHDDAVQHDRQLQVLRALFESGRSVAIGLEMFEAGQDAVLRQWIDGTLAEEDFVAVFHEQWRLPWSLYRDIFRYARKHRIPLFGLNVPRDIVAQVAREGFDSLSPEQLRRIPGARCTVHPAYRALIRRMVDEEAHAGSSFQNFCEAQMVWDSAMAEHLKNFLERHPERTAVVLTGDAHAWRHGIPARLRERSDIASLVVLQEQGRITRETMEADDADLLFINWRQRPTVLFDEGHGQRFRAEGAGDLDLSGLADLFRLHGFAVRIANEPLRAATLAGADALVMSGAFRPPTAAENAAIRTFIEDGGRAAIMLHIGPPLSGLLRRLGVVHSNGVIREQEHLAGSKTTAFQVQDLPKHPLTRGLSRFTVIGAWAVLNDAPHTRLIARTSPRAWVDLNGNDRLDGGDAVQPLGVAVTGSLGKGRYVVFGDDAIFQNRYLKDENQTLAKNLVKWLGGVE